MPLYGSYKHIVSKLTNVKTIVWQLQGNCLKVAEYDYHSMVVTRKFFQSCEISTPLYGSFHGNCLKVAEYEYHCIVVTRKLFQSCGMSTPLCGSYKQPVSKLRNVKTIVWQLQENCVKVAEYENHSMVVTRKSFQSCGM